MTTIKKVSTSTDPDDRRDDLDTLPGSATPEESVYFDARVPAKIIDTLRKEVRHRFYGSSTEEAETIRKTDEELFERVRTVERKIIEDADKLLARNKGRTGQALAYLDKIEELRERLRAGEDSTAVVKEFNKLESKIRSREIKVLRGMAEEASTLRADVADPVERTQHLYSLMPIRFGRSAGLISH